MPEQQFNFNLAEIISLSVHRVGNRDIGETLTLNDSATDLEKDAADRLSEGILKKFGTINEVLHFVHPEGLEFHVLNRYISKIFNGDIEPHLASLAVARQLFEVSLHPKVREGELYCIHFKNIGVGDEAVQGYGLFKSETKWPFLQASASSQQVSISLTEGVELSKFDKGCLILDTNGADGYDIRIYDKQNSGEEAQYWKRDFLGLATRDNEYTHTQQAMQLAKSYITKQLNEDFEVGRTEQIDLLNRTAKYFKDNEVFEKAEFANSVLQDERVVRSFANYEQEMEQRHNLQYPDTFDISGPAVSKQQKIFKSILKLDKNFHVYIHGDRGMIERGTEPDGRKFYKIFYNEES